MKTILVTGGTGFIGSHMAVLLIQAGYQVIILDNLSRSHASVIDGIQQITDVRPLFYQADITDAKAVGAIFDMHQIDGVIHFAALKSVGESMSQPRLYYHNNISGTYNLVKIMCEHQVYNLVFSSSCTVYGNTDQQPLTESSPKQACSSVYGWTKTISEDMLAGLCQSINLKVCSLRYFNPIGAHPSGLIGEYPVGIPDNLLPYVMGTASGIYPYLRVYGQTYATPDGTALRDYIHVMDLVQAHMQAIQRLQTQSAGTYDTFNLGTGMPSSVLDIVHIAQTVTGREIAYQICDHRPGDVVVAYADPSKAEHILGRKAKKTVTDAITDLRHFRQQSGQV